MTNKKFFKPIVILILFLIGLKIIDSIGFPFIFYIFICFIGYKLINKILSKRQKNPKRTPAVSKNKYEHYQSLGMTDDDIKFFRQTMSETKSQIVKLEENMEASAKLKAIDLRYDTIKLSKSLFKELVKNPTKLHLADQFLYHHLPNVLELTNKHLEIAQHEVKNKATYDMINDSAQAIEAVSQLIKQDYESFVADDLESMEIEIEIAKQNLDRHSKNKHLGGE